MYYTYIEAINMLQGEITIKMLANIEKPEITRELEKIYVQMKERIKEKCSPLLHRDDKPVIEASLLELLLTNIDQLINDYQIIKTNAALGNNKA